MEVHRIDYSSAVRAVLRDAADAHQAKKDRVVKRTVASTPKILLARAGVFTNMKTVKSSRRSWKARGKTSTVYLTSSRGLPKLADHSIDAAIAVRVLNDNFGAIGQGAAGDFHYAAAMKIKGEMEVSGPGPWAASLTQSICQITGSSQRFAPEGPATKENPRAKRRQRPH